jgi:mannosyltransferase OCH1-like enzyme
VAILWPLKYESVMTVGGCFPGFGGYVRHRLHGSDGLAEVSTWLLMSHDSHVDANVAGFTGSEWSSLVIPRILHQTVKDKGNMPSEWRDCRATWIKMLGPKSPELGAECDDECSPGDDSNSDAITAITKDGQSTLWEFRLWDDYDNEEFVRTRYPQYYQLYKDLPRPINRVDFVRYLYMHAHGGFYADADTRCLKSIESLRTIPKCSIVLGEHVSLAGKFVECAFIGSVPGHPFWLRVAEAIKAALYQPSWTQRLAQNIPSMAVLTQTGPFLLTQVVQRELAEKGPEKSGIRVFAPQYFYPDPRERPFPKEAFVVHMFSGSWVDDGCWDAERHIFHLQQSTPGRFLIGLVITIVIAFIVLLLVLAAIAATRAAIHHRAPFIKTTNAHHPQ